MDNFMKLIKPQTDASEIGEYIRENIKDVDASSSEKMIEYLIIYQTETIDDFNEKLDSLEYTEALNKDMGGDLESGRIKNISNERVKKDYQNLIDSFLTVKRYEENPVVKTNWKALNNYSFNIKEQRGHRKTRYYKSNGKK